MKVLLLAALLACVVLGEHRLGVAAGDCETQEGGVAGRPARVPGLGRADVPLHVKAA